MSRTPRYYYPRRRSRPHERPHHSDHGLQPERTSLSWTRTILAMVVCSLVILRWATGYPAAVFVVLAVVLVLAAWLYLSNRDRYEMKVRGIRDERVAPATAQFAVMAGIIAGLAVLTAVLVALE